ncbi:MAG: hypothetical protein GQ535_14855 [Rhodobacteraceae bacterium]|nr:hypothetical protein [Paracoccaceae bacterium]
MLEDLKRWKAPQEVIDAYTPEEAADYVVWEGHWKTVWAFLNVCTQWRVAVGMGGMLRLGFDYAGVRAGLKLARIKLKPREWDELRIMEAAAREALNEEQT